MDITNFLQDKLIINLIYGILLSAVVSILSFKVKFLTKSGSFAMFFLAALIFGFGGWKWTVPIFLFFLLSSLLSVIRKSRNKSVEEFFVKTGKRDYAQVLANGGLSGVLVIFYYFFQSELIYCVFVSSVAAVCADTWATEIGTMFDVKTVDLLTSKEVPQGESGGISVIGIFGSVLGAVIISASSLYWINAFQADYFLIMASAGVFGSIVDSFLGATLQAKYECVICQIRTERIVHCNNETQLKRGHEWLTNDLVNFFASVSGGLFCTLILGFM
ncbi:MAG: DUF92 domain-containing protein [Ignavibacteriales bacterium]|nr:MAG: DUF92 domain-containing protein [Ignavibacteriales bacterium]